MLNVLSSIRFIATLHSLVSLKALLSHAFLVGYIHSVQGHPTALVLNVNACTGPYAAGGTSLEVDVVTLFVCVICALTVFCVSSTTSVAFRTLLITS